MAHPLKRLSNAALLALSALLCSPFPCGVLTFAGKVNWASRVSEENSRLLQVQNPSLAGEETWAHATAQPEVGGLLLASRHVPDTDKYWQVWKWHAYISNSTCASSAWNVPVQCAVRAVTGLCSIGGSV